MSDLRHVAEVAFRLHEEGRIDKAELVHILEQCLNAVALENGYADEHGLPFPEHATARRSA